jgi:hypothetical protein
MIKKLFILFFICNVINIVSCCRCTNATESLIKFTGLHPENLKVYYDDNYITADSTNDSIVDIYGIEITFPYELLADLDFTPSFQFMNKAYACDCEDKKYAISNKIKNVDIITLRDFDSTHLANTNITDYFFSYTLPTHDGDIYKKITINEAIKNGPFLLSYSPYLTRINAILDKKHKPSMDQNIQFEINVTLEDSSKLSAKTKTIKLTP